MPITLLNLANVQDLQNGSEDLSQITKKAEAIVLDSSENDCFGFPSTNPVENYTGIKATVHKLSHLLFYSEIYQNFIWRWDLKIEQEDANARINELRTIFSTSNNNTKLPKFLVTFQNIGIYYANLVAELYHRNKASIERFVKSNPSPYYDFLMKQFKKFPPSTIVNMNLNEILKDIKHGDLIDIDEHRGTGLFIVYLDSDARNLEIINKLSSEERLGFFHVLPTLGDWGHILPEPGFNLLKEHGLGFFIDSEITGFQISDLRDVRIKIEDGTYESATFRQPIYLETSLDMELDSETMYEVRIDGVYLFGYLTENYI